MPSFAFPIPAALIVGHPGHELRLFHWLECVRPVVFVITDGSGSGRSRTASTRAVLEATGSTAGSILGAFTDVEIYDAMLTGNVTAVAAATESIAASLVEHKIRTVVADAVEFYNPTHDLCAVVATFAAACARLDRFAVIERFDYPVTTTSSGEGIVLELTPADVERKLAAAYAFENLTGDVDRIVQTLGKGDLAREIIRPVSAGLELPVPSRKPFYETHGEERVASGRYAHVLRYEDHFVPFVNALAAALGLRSATARTRVRSMTA